MAKELLTQPIKYFNIMMKFTALPRYLHFLSNEGNLKDVILKIKMQHFEETVDELVAAMPPTLSEVEKLAHKTDAMAKMEVKNRKIVDEYPAVLFNQALVMACTVFDTFLVDCMRVLTTREPRILKGLGKDKDITFTEVIDLGDYDNVFQTIQNKVLDRFDFGGIRDKIDTMQKIGIDMKKALEFKFQTEEAQERHSEGSGFLSGLYEKRHDIVHRGLLPIQNVDELEKVEAFFSDLMLNIGMAIREKFKIDTDFHLMLTDPQSLDI